MKVHPPLLKAPETSCVSITTSAEPGNLRLNCRDGLPRDASASMF